MSGPPWLLHHSNTNKTWIETYLVPRNIVSTNARFSCTNNTTASQQEKKKLLKASGCSHFCCCQGLSGARWASPLLTRTRKEGPGASLEEWVQLKWNVISVYGAIYIILRAKRCSNFTRDLLDYRQPVTSLEIQLSVILALAYPLVLSHDFLTTRLGLTRTVLLATGNKLYLGLTFLMEKEVATFF